MIMIIIIIKYNTLCVCIYIYIYTHTFKYIYMAITGPLCTWAPCIIALHAMSNGEGLVKSQASRRSSALLMDYWGWLRLRTVNQKTCWAVHIWSSDHVCRVGIRVKGNGGKDRGDQRMEWTSSGLLWTHACTLSYRPVLAHASIII